MSGTKRTSVRVLCCVIAAIFVLSSVFVLVQKMSAGQKAEEEIPEWEAYLEWDKVTAGLITREGLYRVYLEDIGYCEMAIPFDSPQADS